MSLKKILNLKNTLLFRLTVLYAIAFTVLASIGFLIFYYRIYDVTLERLDEELVDEVQRFSALIRQSDVAGVREAIAEEMEGEDPSEEFYRLFNFDGETLMSTDTSSWGTIAKGEILSKMQGQGRTHAIQSLTMGESDDKARMITAVIGPDKVLQIGESLEEFEDYLDIFLELFSILVASLIVVSAFIGWLLARRATIDVQEVTQTAEEISKGAYERRVRIKGRLKEIERLGATVNHMLDRIHILLKSMKEINDNIAHDLRSPLARIRGTAEMLLLSEKPIADYKDMAASTIEECDALIGMINTMLDITEAEAGVNGTQAEKFDLTALIRKLCELFRPVAEQKKVFLKTDLPDALWLTSDRKKMQRIVTNLLENAIKYTPAGGTVTVSGMVQNGEIRLEFDDTGIGISESDLPRIFERFYRCDRSRSQVGVGLGLSLVKAYTALMGGTIQVASRLNQGSRFTINFAS